MRGARYFITSFLIVLLFAATAANAQVVEVFKALEEDVSQQQLRRETMAAGFGRAIEMEARLMLPGELAEERAQLLTEYMEKNGQPYVQSYKILSTVPSEEGLTLRLDVKVNKTALRSGLKSMGLFDTLTAPLAANVTWPEEVDEEFMAALQGLMTLYNIQVTPDAPLVFAVEFVSKKGKKDISYKGRFEMDEREYLAINKDLSVVWSELWSRYFNRVDSAAQKQQGQMLTVTGWFSPDAVLEFDSVLHSWESAVQKVELVELDMQPSGVGGTWVVHLLDSERLKMLLGGYLPQRGLTYLLSAEAQE